MSNKAPHFPSKPAKKFRDAKVAIGYCHGKDVDAFFHGSLLHLLNVEAGRVTKIIDMMSSPKVDTARNRIVESWLKTSDADYLLMVDADMVLPEDTIERLINHDKDIACGLYFLGSGTLKGGLIPTLHVINQENKDRPLDILWDYPTNALVQVAGTGAGCMLIKREVAEKMLIARGEDHPMPWFAYGVHNGVAIGEDIAFCLTANKMGFEVWVDTGLIPQHVKPSFLGEEQYAMSLLRPEHPAYEQRESIPVYQEFFHGSSS
jgi:hypothetical protein